MPKKKLLPNRSIKIPLVLLRGYQFIFSPDHGAGAVVFGRSRCRFFPSCSEYSAEAIRQYGLLAGSMVSLKRIMRCNPWNRGGYDPIRKRSQES